MAFLSCTNTPQVKDPQDAEPAAAAPDSSLVAAAENNIKAHQEDIQALWELSIGEDKAFAKYAIAKDYVFLSTDDGKEGILLSFYKDMKDIDNFDGIDVCEGQVLSFLDDAVVVKEKTDEGDKATYYKRTEREGFNQLFTVTDKDGKKTYTNDLNEPYDEKEAQDFLDKIGAATEIPLSDVLSAWYNL